jgi:hypothetical protein
VRDPRREAASRAGDHAGGVMTDAVNHPAHYTSSAARCECGKGIECIQVTEHLGFNVGNAIKYLWRADLKGSRRTDLEKARWYVDREIGRLSKLERTDRQSPIVAEARDAIRKGDDL